MKKIILSLSLCLVVAATVAQGQESSNNSSYLPQAGDFALGLDASPFLRYTGNLFSLSGNNDAPTFSGLQGQGIYGKYFLTDNQAIRAKLLLNIYSTSNKQSVQNDEAISTTPNATAIDTKTTGTTDVDLSLGYELRRGIGRIQGFFGGELALGLDRTSTAYEYGNPMTVANSEPTTGFQINPSRRTLESKGGVNFTCGLHGFVGVEYFIANQVSIGGEFTLGLATSVRGQNEVTYQEVVAGEVREATERSRSSDAIANTFGIKTVTEGSIFLLFYF